MLVEQQNLAKSVVTSPPNIAKYVLASYEVRDNNSCFDIRVNRPVTTASRPACKICLVSVWYLCARARRSKGDSYQSISKVDGEPEAPFSGSESLNYGAE